MSLAVINSAHSEDFTSATTWTVNHNLGTSSPVIDTYDGSDTRIMPADVVVIDENTVRVDWSVATAGRVYVV